MSDKFVMSSRQAAELDHAFERNGWSPEDVKWLSSGDTLSDFRKVRLGYSKIIPVENVIDCDADPWLPGKDWSVEEHRKGGRFSWNPAEQAKPEYQYLSGEQKNGKAINGNALRKELADKPVLNANVLDWLLKKDNQRFIPEEWKDGKARFFWGTIYRGPDGNLNVRYLRWYGGKWHWSWHWLGFDWHEYSPAVLRAGSSVRS